MRLWRLIILREMMLEEVIGVLVMEVDKGADEVADITSATWWRTWRLTMWPTCWS